MQSSINELMFVAVEMNGIGMKAVVDTRAMHSFLASNVVAKLGLKIEAHDIVVTSLNGGDDWVDSIIRFVPLTMGECIGFCDLIVMYLWDYKKILGMGF